jgi:hypothetical protein
MYMMHCDFGIQLDENFRKEGSVLSFQQERSHSHVLKLLSCDSYSELLNTGKIDSLLLSYFVS